MHDQVTQNEPALGEVAADYVDRYGIQLPGFENMTRGDKARYWVYWNQVMRREAALYQQGLAAMPPVTLETEETFGRHFANEVYSHYKAYRYARQRLADLDAYEHFIRA